jgi:hypothetical protein
MKINSDITAPLYMELICRKGIETDNLINEIMDLATMQDCSDVVLLEGIVDSILDNEKSVVIISITVKPASEEGLRAIHFIKSVFENFFSYYPKYTEPI